QTHAFSASVPCFYKHRNIELSSRGLGINCLGATNLGVLKSRHFLAERTDLWYDVHAGSNDFFLQLGSAGIALRAKLIKNVFI
ncbi:MAG: hypothetical protein WAK41_06835, partial [Roseiarcus sp.]|uniref:hypothetical protein n=1 Tax=Roseiarcus sp. TaxID=1969460 RepID=UPI003BB1CDA8